MLHMMCTLQISFWVLLEYNKLHYRGHNSLPVLTVQHEGVLVLGRALGCQQMCHGHGCTSRESVLVEFAPVNLITMSLH